VTWTDGKGLYLRFGSAPGPVSPFAGSYLLIDQIRDGHHWLSSDATKCPVKVTKQDASGLTGSASCTGLRWMDAMSSSPLEPGPVAGQPPFDVDVTFQAAP
jgi:hypothetical protein